MMNRKFLLAIVMFLLLALLGGCSLAVAEAEQLGDDRLIGAFVTTEYLDLFDIESYLNDNIADISKDGGQISEDDMAAYQGRIYAELVPSTLTSEDSGEQTEFWDYLFTGLEGIHFFCARITPPDGESYLSTSSDDAVSEVHLSIGNLSSLEGTVYVAPSGRMNFYANPVYQSADGRVYLVPGSGISSSGEAGEGNAMSFALEESYTTTKNGETTEEGFRFELHLATKYPPISYSIIQMSADSTLLTRTEYRAAELPERISPQRDTAYIIVETTVRTTDGPQTIRDIYSPADDHFISYSEREDGVLIARTTELLWP